MGGTAGWIVLAVVGWAFGLLLVIVLCRMSGTQDRAARHAEKKLIPFSDVTITQYGNR